MYAKPIAIPNHILQALALNSRIPDTHRNKHSINQNAANLYSGFKGEKSLNYNLSFLPEDDFLIFHYLRIPDDKGHFQLDFLLLSIYFFLIIEVKNIYDHVNFDEMGQTYRGSGEKVEIFKNPVDQVNLQHRRLLSWLRKYNFPAIPIEKIVVFSQDKTYLKNLANDKVISDIVMHRDKVLPKIDLYMNKHKSVCCLDNQLLELSYQLLKQHNPEEYDGIKKFDITTDDLIKGVICPGCGSIPMIWQSGKWLCAGCGFKSKTAHQPTLTDYALLAGEYINNREARDFLKLDSDYIIKRILRQEQFEHFGETSGRKYKIDLEKLQNAEVHNEYVEVHRKNVEVHNSDHRSSQL
ncbi:nuclease-related domain-containing protein [Virgibacillus doumboii]|uniref:nuclease-related domain-containing protein n=1 Tax=Virgibacillus doumboii TaxID=2697503 RepID=UPI0013DFAB71|nr:nuclease-related domain-containing protein [Virgibacillus doumboii]